MQRTVQFSNRYRSIDQEAAVVLRGVVADAGGRIGGEFTDNINPDSLQVVKGAKLEPSLKDAEVGEPFQFMRQGYFNVDPLDSQPGKPVFNRTVITALVLTFGLHLTFGTYEVVWSIYLIALGASVAWVSLTFVIFGIPEVIMGPIAGRIVDT